MVPMIRTASLRGFVDLVEELGGDADALLARHGLARDVLGADDGLIPITANDLVLDAAAAELACPDLGLRLAEAQDLSVLGPLAVVIESSSTVAEALRLASRYMFVHSPALSVGVEADPYGARGVVALTYRKDLHESPYSPQAMELGLGLFQRIARVLVGSRAGLRSVEFPHQPLSPVRRYTEFFGADVRFGRPAGALRVERHLLDGQFATADATIRRLAVEYLADRYADPAAAVSTQVRRALAGSLGAGPPALGGVARLLSVHPRTLQRRLAAEGTTFEAVLDEVRRDAAHRYLTTTRLPLGQVAALVGFTEQSTLSHCVRRWFGTSPRALRRAADSGPGLSR
ncbi:helix-turn-helix domain-containing protein [Streptomyces sp. SID5785]|uniref:AraC family transcriptional regulator n=1 Tax=Streptomyces sp. SID5785 TaxID=2690309 RepID=UPI001361836B|nr:AraC family transcriptional regulator [Streptomyces sp. SID5785]MZD08869.1 helix-turn-helix domain-containing protein [Streptomyces sp. SID5785]